MKNKLIPNLLFVLILTIQTACSNKPEGKSENDNANRETEKNDTTLVGVISLMSYSSNQSGERYCIILDNGLELRINAGRGGQIGTDGLAPFHLNINQEAKNILFEEKTDESRINSTYLLKKVNVSFDKFTKVITKLNVIENGIRQTPISQTITGNIMEMKKDSLDRKLLVMFSTSGSTYTIPLFVNEKNSYTITSVYDGLNDRSICIFDIKHYSISLIPEAKQKLVDVQVENVLTKHKETIRDTGYKFRFFYENVVKDIHFSENQESQIETGSEQQ